MEGIVRTAKDAWRVTIVDNSIRLRYYLDSVANRAIEDLKNVTTLYFERIEPQGNQFFKMQLTDSIADGTMVILHLGKIEAITPDEFYGIVENKPEIPVELPENSDYNIVTPSPTFPFSLSIGNNPPSLCNTPPPEKVNHPSHYNMYSVEVLEMMKRIYGVEKVKAFCELNAFKYRMRLGHKDDIQTDLAKEKFYLDYLKTL